MIRLSIKQDFEAALRQLNGTPKQIEKVARRSLNKMAQRARTVARRHTARRMGVKQSAIKNAITVKRASAGGLTSAVKGSGKPLSLIHFGAKQTRRGVTARAYGERKLYPETFIQKSRGGGSQVFVRERSSRLPIRKLWGPGVPSTMAQEEIIEALEEKVRTDLPKIIEQEGRFVLRTGR
jgi:hypothetical protein